MGVSNRFILNQDRRVVVTQTPLDSSLANDDRLIGADRAISLFRRWRSRLMAEAETGVAEVDLPENQPLQTD